MHHLRLLVLVLIVLLPWSHTLPALAQEASPAAVTWVGQEPDLAAIPLTPQDLAALGLPGFGRFFNGYYNTLDGFVEGTAGFYQQPVSETQAVFDRMGLRRMFGSAMGLSSTPGDPESAPQRGAYTNVIEISHPAEADAFLTYILATAAEEGTHVTATEAPFTLGDGAVITNFANYDAESNETYYEFAVIFRVGTIYVDTGLWANRPGDIATPIATPGAADAALTSPAGTVAELEAIGQAQAARIAEVLSNGGPNLPALLLRLGDDPLDATSDYTEGYRLLDGELLPYFADREDDLIADPAMLTGVTAAYELEEKFQPGEEPGPNDFYFLTRLFAFPDAVAAHAFMASRPDVLAAGGFAKVPEARSGTGETVLPGEVTELGDESLAFSFVRAFDDGEYVGHEIYVRVGNTVAAMSLEGPSDTPLQVVADIAVAQAACLEAEACPQALPVPEVILAATQGDVDADSSVAGTPVLSTPVAGTSAATPGAEASASTEIPDLLWQSVGGSDAELYAAGSVVVAPDGNVWIFDGGGGRFQIFSPDGDYLESWDGTGGGGAAFNFEGASDSFDGDVAFDDEGHIYVVEAGAHRVQVFDADRTLLTSWGSFGTKDGQFVYPMGLALDSSGNIYISDNERDDIQVFAPDGTFLRHFGSHGSDLGQLSGAGYLAIDGDDTVWVADGGNNRVVAFAPDGTAIAAWGTPNQFRRPTDVVVDADGHLYVADLDHGQIQVLDGDGAVVATWEAGQTPTGDTNLPYSVALDRKGALYISGVGSDHNSDSNLQKLQLSPLP